METMNYNRVNKKSSKKGIIFFTMFTVVGTAAVAHLIVNEPKPQIVAQDLYVPVSSENLDNIDKNSNETNNNNITNVGNTNNVDVYSEVVDLSSIEYNVEKNIERTTSGKFKQNIATPKITIDEEELKEINKEIVDKFTARFDTLKSESSSLEHKFTYKVTYNLYESELEGKRVISFTFYERIIDDSTGADTAYKLYGYTIDLATKKVVKQEDVAPNILGANYKESIKETVKDYVISKKLYTEENYDYTLTGLEEFYIKKGEFHIMFNPSEMGKNKDYLDIVVE